MRLSEVIEAAGARGEAGGDAEIALLTADSREVRPGAVFFALRGARADGHTFASAAARAGAAAVVAERPVECAPARLALVNDARRALSLAAARFHGEPARRLALAGVTGTNGKTTVAWLAEACLAEAGIPAGLVGTVAYRWPGAEREAPLTTPDPVALHGLLAEMVRAGARAALLEVSSHALDQERVAGLLFRAAGFTNLTRDHLDYHGDLPRYFAAKRRLFEEHLAPGGVAVVNLADPHGARLAEALRRAGTTAWGYRAEGDADLRPLSLRSGLAGIDAEIATPSGPIAVRSPLVGAHNVENLLCAAGLALALGAPAAAVARGLSACRGAPGRLERIEASGVAVFVDYAHTHDALARVLSALRALGPRRLVAVFGCGGDRDRGKRPLMGEAVARAADLAVATSDNPRGEDPAAILAEIVPGLERGGLPRIDAARARQGGRGYAVVPDRREAIALAVAAARPGDAVLVAGKGHETCQIVGAERRRFDDREEARRALGIPGIP